jgi:saccharopine dehydrogenase-like NADP-dependent oxidoreductase
MSGRTEWMIYGANGYTGHLVAAEARRRGLNPVLAGRRAGPIEKLAAELGLTMSVFDLHDAPAAAAAITGIAVVANCAGPFAATSAPMINACLSSRAHYLDITGEIERSAGTRMRGQPESSFVRAWGLMSFQLIAWPRSLRRRCMTQPILYSRSTREDP